MAFRNRVDQGYQAERASGVLAKARNTVIRRAATIKVACRVLRINEAGYWF